MSKYQVSSKFSIKDHVRVTDPAHHRFDQVLTVIEVIGCSAGTVWLQADDSPEMFTAQESALVLADSERQR